MKKMAIVKKATKKVKSLTRSASRQYAVPQNDSQSAAPLFDDFRPAASTGYNRMKMEESDNSDENEESDEENGKNHQ